MKSSLLLGTLLATAAAFANAQDASPSAPSAGSPPPKIPLRDFFKNPDSREYLLSPDGKTLSYLAPWETRMNIWVRPAAGGEAKRVSSEKDRDIREYFWKGNDFLIYAQDTRGDENFHLFRVNLKTGEVKDLTPFEKVRANLIDDLSDVSPTDILLEHNKRNKELFDAYRMNVATGEMKMVAPRRSLGKRSQRPNSGCDRNRRRQRNTAHATRRQGTLQKGPDHKFPRTSGCAVFHIRQQTALCRFEYRARQAGDRHD
jgi:hypothetical protein